MWEPAVLEDRSHESRNRGVDRFILKTCIGQPDLCCLSAVDRPTGRHHFHCARTPNPARQALRHPPLRRDAPSGVPIGELRIARGQDYIRGKRDLEAAGITMAMDCRYV